MGGIKHYSLEEKNIIEEFLKKQNGPVTSLAKILKRSISGLWYEINKGGGKENYTSAKSEAKNNQLLRKRGGNSKNILLNDKEKNIIKKMRLDGKTYGEIAIFLKRATSTIFREVNSRKIKNYGEEIIENESIINLKQRIENLEMQMEILHDTLKEISKR